MGKTERQRNKTSRPPRLADRLFAALCPERIRDDALGDLHEEYLRFTAPGFGGLRARFWYWRQVIGSLVKYRSHRNGTNGRGEAPFCKGRRLLAAPVDVLSHDLRHSFRTLRRSPGFATVAVLSLSIGIGANTAIFTAVNAILIRQRPLAEPEQLVNIYRHRQTMSFEALNYPDYLEILGSTREVFVDIGGMQFAFANREVNGGVETLIGKLVTGNYFPLLGVTASLGRTILPEDHVSPGAHPVVVLGHRFWLREFAGDPAVIGRSLRLSGNSYTIVGVAPKEYPGFFRGVSPDFFAPIMMVNQILPLGGNPLESRGWNSFNVIGRLRDGVSQTQVDESLKLMAAHLRASFPAAWPTGDSFAATATEDVLINPLADGVVTGANYLALVVAGLVLLIACANLASILLARSTSRRREIAVRLALGGTRGRLARQLVTETLVLSLLGGIGGLLVAAWLIDVAVAVTTTLPVPLVLDLRFDWVVLSFSVFVTVATGILVGLVPGLHATRPGVAATLKSGTAAKDPSKAHRLGELLVAGQVAVSLLLLIGAGLFIRSFVASRQIDPGFGREPAALVTFVTPADRFSAKERLAYVTSFAQDAELLPGVTDTGIICNIHLNLTNRMFLDINVDGVPPPPDSSSHVVDFTSVGPGFFDAAGIPILQGRSFTDDDRADTARVAIVNQAFAQKFWPAESPLGQTVKPVTSGWPDLTVVGISATAKIRTIGESPRPFIYLPYAQETNATTTVIARTEGDPRATAGDLYRLLRKKYPAAIVSESNTLAEHIEVMLVARRLSAVLASVFAAVAMALAIVGLYGVVSYAVSRRGKEMGIRMSVGAGPGSVVRLMVTHGMRLVLLGGVVGLLAAVAAGRLVSGFLFEVSPFDPLTLVLVPGALAAAALLAAYIPARRASRVDPVRSLRAD